MSPLLTEKIRIQYGLPCSGDENPAGKVEIDFAQEFVSCSLNVDVSKSAVSAHVQQSMFLLFIWVY